MSGYKGDFLIGGTVDCEFNTWQFTTGAPFALASGAVAAYVGNSTTEITAGITLSPAFDGRTGFNNVRVVASVANGFAIGTDVKLVLTAGTVDSVSVAGAVVGSFSIENRTWNVNKSTVPIAPIPALLLIGSGAFQSGSTGTAWKLDAAQSFPASVPNGAFILVTSGSGVHQRGNMDGWDNTTKIATVSPSAAVTPSAGDTYLIYGSPAASSTNDVYARLGAPTGASIAVDISNRASQASVDLKASQASVDLKASQATVDSILTDTGTTLDAKMNSIVSLLDDARAEPGQGTPPMNPDAMVKIDYLYKAWRNRKTQTATELKLMGDDGTTVDQKSTVSDDNVTAVRGEFISGP